MPPSTTLRAAHAWDSTAPGLSSGSRPSLSRPISTLPPSSLASNPLSSSTSRNSRINRGAHLSRSHASSGDHHLKTQRTHPYHEARGKNRPSSAPMESRVIASGQVLFYLRDTAEADCVVAKCLDQLKGPLGLDLEYRPNFIKGRPPNKTALIQLASESMVLLVQVSAMSEFPRSIRGIIEDPTIIKAGVGIQSDADKLWRDFGLNAASCLELGYLARAVDPQWATSKGLISLARLVKAYENRVLQKPKRIQISNWESFLSEEQQDYAANDANAGRTVLRELYKLLPSIQPPPAKALYIFDRTQHHAQIMSATLSTQSSKANTSAPP